MGGYKNRGAAPMKKKTTKNTKGLTQSPYGKSNNPS